MKSPWIALALALCARVGLAQDADPPREDATPPPAASEGDPPPPAAEAPARRDPTAGASGWQAAPVGAQVSTTLPPVALKARVFVRGRPPAALLLIDQTLHLVRAGSAIALPGLPRGATDLDPARLARPRGKRRARARRP
ncbi:MAG: hypothetical protein R3F62_19180 [Planctomycetota bacterium]